MTDQPDPPSPVSPTPSALWIAAALLGNQAVMYLTIPVMAEQGAPIWAFYAFTVANSGFLACLLIEAHHWVRQRITHVVNWLIWLDTAIEGAIQPSLIAAGARGGLTPLESLKPVHENLYCVAAFAGVYMIWLAYCRLWRNAPM